MTETLPNLLVRMPVPFPDSTVPQGPSSHECNVPAVLKKGNQNLERAPGMQRAHYERLGALSIEVEPDGWVTVHACGLRFHCSG